MVKMLNGGKAVRDKDGVITKAAAFQGGEKDLKPGRVMPDRKWFGRSSFPCCTGFNRRS
jgi:nuclear GTP-binding protein